MDSPSSDNHERVEQGIPKHRQIYESLHRSILSGEFPNGARLPSEAEFVEQFGASRPTVARALRDLQEHGFIERRAGSGTFVRLAESQRSHVFGLLIPELGVTEIFEPICQGMIASPYHGRNALLRGNSGFGAAGTEVVAEQLCQQYIQREVSGVFFAPLELTTHKDEVNEQIISALDRVNIPVILLDRDIYSYPRRSGYDLVGIDNRRAGYTITEHLVRAGAKRIAFLARPQSASTVDARISGYRETLFAAGRDVDFRLIWRGEGSDPEFVRGQMQACDPDAILCANDDTAAHLMNTLDELAIPVPERVRIAGFDDVRYANLLRVPLTTIRQPCLKIGAVAMAVMLERLEDPNIPARDILLDFELVPRRSSGA